VYFYLYDRILEQGDKILKKNKTLFTYCKWPMPFIAAVTSDLISFVFYLPFETVRIRCQINSP